MISGLAQLLLWRSVQAQSDLRQLTSDTVLTTLTSLEASLNRAWATESASRGLVGVAVAGGGLQENISCLLDDGGRGAGRWVLVALQGEGREGTTGDVGGRGL